MVHRALTAFIVAVSVTDASPPDGYHPVIVVGPLIGQSLEVKQQNGDWCDTDGWFWEWGNFGNLTGTDVLCIPGHLDLAGWDNNTGRAVPKEGVEVRPRGGWHGGWADLASMDLLRLESGDAAVALGPRLRASGFVQDESFSGHSYDWRLSVGDWAVQSFPDLKTKVEQACAVGGADKVVLTGISMACPYIHSFISWMRAQDPDWVQRHVHALVPIAGPWNGAVSDTTAIVSTVVQSYVAAKSQCPDCTAPIEDDDLREPSIVDYFEGWAMGLIGGSALAHSLTSVTNSWPSLHYLATGVDSSTTPPTDPTVITLVNGELPAACSVDDGFRSKCGAQQTRGGWRFDDKEFLAPTQCAACYVNLQGEECSSGYEMARADGLCCERHDCPAKEYRASELPEFFRTIGREESAQMMEHALTYGSTSSDPGVPVHCIFGYNVQTFSANAFSTTEDMDAAIVTIGDGDGTVDIDSLEVCTRWASTEKVYKIPGISHVGSLGVKQVLDVVLAVALNDVEALRAWREPAQSEVVAQDGVLKSEDELFNAAPAPAQAGLVI